MALKHQRNVYLTWRYIRQHKVNTIRDVNIELTS